jgi:hypothetical protein
LRKRSAHDEVSGRECNLRIVFQAHIFASTGFPGILANPVVATIATLIGIALAAIGIILTRRYRERPRMVYQTHDSFVVGQPDASALGEIKIIFNNNTVPRVVVTQLGIWNAGNTTIRGSDIVAGDPLVINIESGSLILGSTRLKATREANDFHIRLSPQDRSQSLLEFDYLDTSDGAVFQIVHTGGMGSVKVKGSVRGVPRGLENWGDLQEWSQQKSKISNALAPLLFLAAVCIPLYWIKHSIVSHYPAATKYFDMIGAGFVVLMVVLMFLAAVSLLASLFIAQSRTTPDSLSRK